MPLWNTYFADIQFSFRKQKELAEKAFIQVSDEEFFRKPGDNSNSIAIIVKHLGGNLKSRWTDFLTTDGEKAWRDRDTEFVIEPSDTRHQLVINWENGWVALFETLNSLSEADLAKCVTIRGEQHRVIQAIHRALTHAAYHAGQIVYVARLVKRDGWQWITVPPGASHDLNSQSRRYLQ
jgi:hypothetical protein